MKEKLIGLLKKILTTLASWTLWKFRPAIIGITGSVGKTSAKLAIASVIRQERNVRSSEGNMNSDLGLCLTILGDWKEEDLELVTLAHPRGKDLPKKAFFWIKVIASALWNIIALPRAQYPEILILEYGADKPGDIRNLLSIARPNIAVITAIGDIPAHVENYAGPQDVAREKARLIEFLPSAGYAIMNYDDGVVMGLRERTRANVTTFGSGEGATVRIASFENRMQEGIPAGIAFKLEYGGSFVPVRLEGVYGRAQSYAAAAAACVGLIYGMNLVEISQGLSAYSPAPGRMRLIKGIKDSLVLDDSYNASPLSMTAAIETMESFPAKRKIAVLGDMMEIGKFAMDSHTRLGKMAARAADVLVTVGPRAKFIAEGAKSAGMKKTVTHSFDDASEAQGFVAELVKKDDIVLVKASHSVGLERVVDALRRVS